MTEAPPLLRSRDGPVLFLTLNRPEKRNALNAALVAALTGALRDAELDPEVRVVAIGGAGPDFCAGADLAELLASVDRSPEENEASALELGRLFLALRGLPKPVLGVVHGNALAGGAGLATACDLVIAAEDARFGYPEIRRGFAPAMVLALLRRLVGEKAAFDLAATGRLVSATEARALGLVSRVVPAGALEAESRALATTLAGSSGSALALIKQLLYRLDGVGLDEAIRLGARINALARTTPEFRELVARFLQR